MIKKFIATINATHAGFVNGNNAFYPEADMAAAVDSWTKPYRKPILRHHDGSSDPIGRVIDARYVPMTPGADNAPRGYIEIKAEITDSEAAKKIADRRYSTVSIGASASKVNCSICDHNIAEDGLCEHIRGKVYDGQKAHWKMGGLKYKECSYVNSPADEYSDTISLEEAPIAFQNGDSQTSVKEETSMKYTFDDEEDHWKGFTEEDIQMAHWLMTELDAELGDKKISSEKRKELSSSAFCGPNRSFPVEMGAGNKTSGLNGETLTDKADGNPVRFFTYSNVEKLVKRCVETGSLDVESKKKILDCTNKIKNISNIIRHSSDTKTVLWCKTCGKEFDTYTCKIKDGRGQFCSRKCIGISNGIRENLDDSSFINQDKNGINNPNYKGGKFIKCSLNECENTFYSFPSRESKYCSTKCASNEHGEKITKDKNPNWKGGKSNNYGSNWKELSDAIRENNPVCEFCGNNSSSDTHHFIPFRITECNDDVNLYALCKSCHSAWDNFIRHEVGDEEIVQTIAKAIEEDSRPDCAHVIAARRLIGRYKGPGDKSRILSCVSSKAKKLGCDGGKDSTGEEMLIKDMTLTQLLDERKDLKEHIDAQVSTATKELQAQLAGFSALSEKTTNLDTEVKTKTKDIETLKAQVTKLETDNTELKTQIHQNLVDRVFDTQKALQKTVITNLKDEKEITVYKAELAKRSDESLRDTLSDLSKESLPLPTEKISGSKPDGQETKTADQLKAEQEDKTKKTNVKDIIFAD